MHTLLDVNVPAVHCVHDVAVPTETEPAAQAVHARLAPDPEVAKPALQVQVVAPTADHE